MILLAPEKMMLEQAFGHFGRINRCARTSALETSSPAADTAGANNTRARHGGGTKAEAGGWDGGDRAEFGEGADHLGQSGAAGGSGTPRSVGSQSGVRLRSEDQRALKSVGPPSELGVPSGAPFRSQISKTPSAKTHSNSIFF